VNTGIQYEFFDWIPACAGMTGTWIFQGMPSKMRKKNTTPAVASNPAQ